MRVLSLVPSLTETLASCGVNLVARTKFCVHPESIQSLPLFGGTKGLLGQSDPEAAKLEWIRRLKLLTPDLLVLDREENQKWMQELVEAELPKCEVHVFHGTTLESMAAEFRKLARVLEPACQMPMQEVADDYQAIFEAPHIRWDWSHIPGELWRTGPVTQNPTEISYVIWKDPWMHIGPDTYIWSVLEKLGAAEYLRHLAGATKYPNFVMPENSAQRFFLFSSEPYPFLKKQKELRELPFASAILDGEVYSWFGVRSLNFLKHHLNLI